MIYYHAPIRNHGKTGPSCFHNRLYTHLSADSEDELVRFALSIGMRKAWLQDSGFPSFHFDVTGNRLRRLPVSGLVSLREYVRRLKTKRERFRVQ